MARPRGSKNKPKDTSVPAGTFTSGGLMNQNRLFNFGAQNQGGIQKQGDFGVSQTSSFFYSPELTTESWLLPKSRQEILKWVRIFFNLEPYIQSITMMHAIYPFSKFEITTSDKDVTKFYEDMAFNQQFDLFRFILQASLSYQKFGEAIMFGNMEKKDKYWTWSKFVLLEPELVEVKTDMLSGTQQFELIPTEELKALVNSNKAEEQERKQQLLDSSPEIAKAILDKRNIKLDDENVSMVARITDPSATRGTSPIQACFKVLIYQDWIRLAQSAFAQRYVFPIELWTIGDLEKNIIPDDDTLTKFRNIINQAIQQPPFSLVFPPIVKYEPLSTLGKQFPINNEYEYIQDQLLVALGVNKNIILGEGPSFSNVQTMALQKLVMTYKVVRDEFESWMVNRFFRPIAEKNGFYTTVNGKKELILPQIVWNKSLDVQEQEQEREAIVGLHKDGYVSTETMFSKFPTLDYATEQKKLELERGTIWDKGDTRLPGEVKKSVVKKPGRGKPPMGGMGDLPMPIEPMEPEVPGSPETGPTEAPAPAGIPEAPTSPETPV